MQAVCSSYFATIYIQIQTTWKMKEKENKDKEVNKLLKKSRHNLTK